MTNREVHEKMSKTALSMTGYLRVIREDIAWMHDQVLASELTLQETAGLDSIIESLQEDITSLRARLGAQETHAAKL